MSSPYHLQERQDFDRTYIKYVISDLSSESSSNFDTLDSQISSERSTHMLTKLLADEERLKNYKSEEEENKKLECALQGRLNNTIQLDSL